MFSHEQYDALRSGAGLLDRHDRGRLRLTGSDRRAYLHGLLTNDIAALSAGHGCYAALLTPQGRMLSDMRVSELGDAILIDLPGSAADAVRQRLADFIFSEDVDVHDVHDSMSQLALYGPEAARMLERVLPQPGPGGLRVNANARWDTGGQPVVAIGSNDFGVEGFELFADPSRIGELGRALEGTGAVRVDPETVEVTRVEAGVPAFGADMDAHTIPLEAGIEDRAISLTKGCYVGQEVIIRVLHRGHGRVAKRLVGFAGEPDQRVLERGQRLQTSDESAKDAGVVTSAVFSPRLRRPIALGYAQRDFAEPGTVLRAPGADGGATTVTVVALPFTAPAAG